MHGITRVINRIVRWAIGVTLIASGISIVIALSPFVAPFLTTTVLPVMTTATQMIVTTVTSFIAQIKDSSTAVSWILASPQHVASAIVIVFLGMIIFTPGIERDTTNMIPQIILGCIKGIIGSVKAFRVLGNIVFFRLPTALGTPMQRKLWFVLLSVSGEGLRALRRALRSTKTRITRIGRDQTTLPVAPALKANRAFVEEAMKEAEERSKARG